MAFWRRAARLSVISPCLKNLRNQKFIPTGSLPQKAVSLLVKGTLGSAVTWAAVPFNVNVDKVKKEMKEHMEKGRQFYQEANFQDAELSLHKALQCSQQIEDFMNTAVIYDLLANVSYDTGHYGEAKNLWVESLKIFYHLKIPDDAPLVVNAFLKVSVIYGIAGHYETAITGFESVLKKQSELVNSMGKNKDKSAIALLGRIKDFYGKFLIQIRQLDEAEKLLSEAIDLCDEYQGLDNLTGAVLFNDLGTLYTIKEDYELAEKYYKKAIHVAKTKDQSHVATYTVNLGFNFIHRKMKSRAKERCKDAMDYAEKYNNSVVMTEAMACLRQADDM